MKSHSYFFRKAIAILLLAVMFCTSAAQVFAATQVSVYCVNLPRGNDSNKSNWGHGQLTFMNGVTYAAADRFVAKGVNSYTGKVAYCVEPGKVLNDGDSLVKDESFWENLEDNKTINASTIQIYISRIMYYGYSGSVDVSWSSSNSADANEMGNMIATQILIWETLVGERNSKFDKVDASVYGYNNILDTIASNHPIRSQIMSNYNRIVSSVQSHSALPSFMSSSSNTAQSIDMAYDSSTGKYKAELIDSNNVLSKFTFTSATPGVSFSVSGNKLTVTSDTAPSGKVSISATKSNCTTVGMIIWSAGGVQSVVTYGEEIEDPVVAYMAIEVSAGSLKIVKTSEDGIVAGIEFTITGTNFSKTVVTGADGSIVVDNLVPGVYTVEETGIDKYASQEAQQITVVSGQIATVTFDNRLKKFRVTGIKSDSETGTAQGDASLAGAVYGLYHNSELVESCTTDKDGRFTTGYHPCGDGWTIREISPSEGYLLDETIYAVEAKVSGTTSVELNEAPSLALKEKVIKGNIAIIKHTDDGSTQIETPEIGAAFEIYLSSVGSYESAKDSERDLLVCDENGFAISKELPYGTYTVKQTKGWNGRELMKPFEVQICTDGETYRYIINNAQFEAYLKVVKVDAETGNAIAYAGAGFRILDSAGNPVTMRYTYPTVATTDIFYTGLDGSLVTPEKLPQGEYSLVEVQAPQGYVLSTEPVNFVIDADHTSDDGGVTVVEIVKENMAQKGVITITKTGESFAGVTAKSHAEETDGETTESAAIYTPVYAEAGLQGAVFEITAATDIYTPDGTLRYEAGTVVDTITTGTDGKASTKVLYLGEYFITEIKAPTGYVRSEEVHSVKLEYSGQQVEITEQFLSSFNLRQKATVRVLKQLEQDDQFNINGDYSKVTFGLFAAEQIDALDGTFIPADRLLEIAGTDADGNVYFNTDIPFGSYYVKELTTDNQHVLSSEIFEFRFNCSDNGFAEVIIPVNNGEPIVNELICGSVCGMKIDNQGASLASAVIGLFPSDSKEFTEDSAILTTVSDEEGLFRFDDVPYGTYIVREIAPPEGYVLSDEVFEVNINEAGQIVEITLINNPIYGMLKITKTDLTDGKLIPNAGFRIKDEAGNVVAEGYTDDNGIAEFELRYGKYTYQEFDAPDGYLLDESEYPFEITEDGQIVTAGMTNELIPVETPQTGDSSMTGLWIAILCIGVLGMAALCTIYLMGYAEKLEIRRYILAVVNTVKAICVRAGDCICGLSGTICRFAQTKLLCRFAHMTK